MLVLILVGDWLAGLEARAQVAFVVLLFWGGLLLGLEGLLLLGAVAGFPGVWRFVGEVHGVRF